MLFTFLPVTYHHLIRTQSIQHYDLLLTYVSKAIRSLRLLCFINHCTLKVNKQSHKLIPTSPFSKCVVRRGDFTFRCFFGVHWISRKWKWFQATKEYHPFSSISYERFSKCVSFTELTESKPPNLLSLAKKMENKLTQLKKNRLTAML
ncbi:hypothetical protein PR048_005269 [Dryococelus australis]|uniref:Uncharacterized protein n=1 Tax=Dryococelus australis TaxID=614101 RepID=A0ABQ9I9V8_9NEOP|nr:hypothetical protein PR048_005269 [Dryococelus australis]